jgi:hypothetical protein
MGSHRSRGSKLDVAAMVSTTTTANASAPGPGPTLARALSCTTVESSATTKTSSIDQRPMASSTRYSRARSSGRQFQSSCTERSSRSRPIILASGTRMLATNTISARCQAPSSHRKRMPLMMVSLCEP